MSEELINRQIKFEADPRKEKLFHGASFEGRRGKPY